MEQVQILSVGIDIGTSTSQLMFSRLTVENTAGYFSIPAVSIVGKDIVYQSLVYRTPLVDEILIDGEGLRQIIQKEYETAGISDGQVETGAIIITGEAARKENARLVLEQLSSFAGDFVVSTAGPDLESIIAGQGSGAQKFSEESGGIVANLDIGGGTTNIVVFDNGEILARGCLDIGGRQVIIDKNGTIAYVSPSAARIAEKYGLQLEMGECVSEDKLQRLCEGMAEVLTELLNGNGKPELAAAVQTYGSTEFCMPSDKSVQYICFSGGVADCIYRTDKEPFAYGDIGVLLGKAIRGSGLFWEFSVIDAAQTIRATVIGAGSYTTTISGSTIAYSVDLFPMKNVPVLKLSSREEEACWKKDADMLLEKIKWFLSQSDVSSMVLAIDGKNNPDYQMLKDLADTVADALDRGLPAQAPVILIVQADIAKALGQLVRQKLSKTRSVISLDEICVEQNNFVDFGKPIMNGLVIPVVVKTLIFN